MPRHSQYLLKLRSVLPLFTMVAWGSVLVLGLVRWFFFLRKYPILEVNEEMWEIYIPAFISFVPIGVCMKFKRLTFKKNPQHRVQSLQFIGYFAISGMLAISQAYLSTFASEIVEVKDVREIGKMTEARYYKIDTFAVHKVIGGAYSTSSVEGRFQSDLKFKIYFVNPILAHKRQILTMTPLYWYGVRFEKKVGNWLSVAEKEERFRTFYEECVNKMLKYDFHKLDHFERKPASQDRENFRLAVSNALRRPVNSDFVILEPKTKVFENKSGKKIAWTFFTFFIGCAIYMLMLIKPGYQGETIEEMEQTDH